MLKGLIIGIGAIAPGFSGGAIAVIFGLYDKLVDSIAHFYIDFKKKFIFLLPLAIGGGVGVLLFSKLLTYFFNNHEVLTQCTLIGLLLGTLPSVYKESAKHGFKKRYILYAALTFALTLTFALLDRSGVVSIQQNDISWWMLVLAGLVVGFGTIIPGISASFILMYLGLYGTLLSIIDRLDILSMIPVGIGCVVSVLAFSHLISYAYKKAYGAISFAVFGLLCGSAISVFPKLTMTTGQDFLAVGLLLVGTAASYAMTVLFQRTTKRRRIE